MAEEVRTACTKSAHTQAERTYHQQNATTDRNTYIHTHTHAHTRLLVQTHQTRSSACAESLTHRSHVIGVKFVCVTPSRKHLKPRRTHLTVKLSIADIIHAEQHFNTVTCKSTQNHHSTAQHST
jgi:hypothetical protein